jgi:ring-1,2-phenylacetyl-CoA epoxidase subunit PaaC
MTTSNFILSDTQKINNTLHLADTTLILGQRNSAWCAHGPILEQDIAITNITLDLIGQARNFYQYAALLINKTSGKNETEDSLAYLRHERDFKNFLICELPNGDWAQTILRQFFFSVYQELFFEKLMLVDDEQIAAIAAKSIKETKYHVKWSSEWVIRLGDGTAESKERMKKAIDFLWMYTGEFFLSSKDEWINNNALELDWLQKVTSVFDEATLIVPDKTFMQSGGKTGKHTEHLGFILAEMQSLKRMHPEAEW